jgi:hypothetical protein
VANTKSRKPIADADIPRIFDDARIAKLADIGRLPPDANREPFAEGVRKAAIIYARDARIPTDNKLNAEIAALYRAAERKQCGQIAASLEELSPKARKLLSKRATRLSLQLPASEALRDTAQQKAACDTVLKLCQHGGSYGKGRRRSSGKRSRTWRPLLHAPKPSRNFPKRDAELNFIMWLQAAWLESAGELPNLAARRALNREIRGPFARMAAECLRLVGAGHADAVGLINELNRRRIQSRPVSHQN